MKYLRQTDGARHTVLMVQVENEVAMVEEAADRSAVARAAFAAPVPQELVDFLIARRAKSPGSESPTPTTSTSSTPLAAAPSGVMRAWTAAGARPAGSWTDLFGAGLATDEIFMAWHFARYVDAVARAGKAEYPLPMFVNAALNRPGAKPGEYPSGGPLPHLLRGLARGRARRSTFSRPTSTFRTSPTGRRATRVPTIPSSSPRPATT